MAIGYWGNVHISINPSPAELLFIELCDWITGIFDRRVEEIHRSPHRMSREGVSAGTFEIDRAQ